MKADRSFLWKCLKWAILLGIVLSLAGCSFWILARRPDCPDYIDIFYAKETPQVYLGREADQCRSPRALPSDSLKFYAYYFPQFHDVSENKMMNDWRYFDGNLGYSYVNGTRRNKLMSPLNNTLYDPRNYYARKTQGHLARSHGIDAFLYYHYWFERAVLGDPIELRLQDGEPNVDFAFAWINNDFKYVNVTYGDPLRHAIYLSRFFMHPAYIKRNGIPILYIKAIKQVPIEYLNELREYTVMLTGRSVLYYQMLMGNLYATLSSHADGFAEFSPNLRLNETDLYVDRGVVTELGLMLNFDNYLRAKARTSKRPGLHIPTRHPELVYKLCFEKLKRRKREENVMIFFAWNEWSEQASLEPNDLQLDYLDAVKRCKRDVLEFDRANARMN